MDARIKKLEAALYRLDPRLGSLLMKKMSSEDAKKELKIGYNDLGWVVIELNNAKDEYPGIPFSMENYLALVDIETKVRGRFFEAMKLIDNFAKQNQYSGILLRAEAQSNLVDQDLLEELYRRAGYSQIDSDLIEGYDDRDVFFVK